MRLWYEQPAGLWEEALPLGNGRLGAMVFGGADDLLCLNEDTFWSGYPQNKDRVGAVRYLSEARRLLDAGDTASAEALVERELLTGYHESYLPLGELRVSLPGAPSDDYRRALSLEEGVVSSCYTADGLRFAREAFVSRPADALVYRVACSDPARSIRAAVSLTSRVLHETTFRPCSATLVMTGFAPDHADPVYRPTGEDTLLYGDRGMGFAVALRALTGRLTEENDTVYAEGTGELVLLLTAVTGFRRFEG